MTKRQLKGNNKRKNEMDCSRFNNKTKSPMVINTCLLVNTLGSQSSFISLHGAIRFLLNSINPLTTNQVVRQLRWCHVPCIISNQSIALLRYSLARSRMLKGLPKGGRPNLVQTCRQGENVVRLNNAQLIPGLARVDTSESKTKWHQCRHRRWRIGGNIWGSLKWKDTKRHMRRTTITDKGWGNRIKSEGECNMVIKWGAQWMRRGRSPSTSSH